MVGIWDMVTKGGVMGTRALQNISSPSSVCALGTVQLLLALSVLGLDKSP